VPTALKSGSLNFLEPYGPVQGLLFTINMELAELGLEGEEWIYQLRNESTG
jgi:hypothetical protein